MIIVLWSMVITVYGGVLTRILFSNRYWMILNSLIVVIQLIASCLYFFDWIDIRTLRNAVGTALGWWAFWITVKLLFQWRSFHLLLEKYQQEEDIIMNHIINYKSISDIEFRDNIKALRLNLNDLFENLNKQYNLIKEMKRMWLRLFLLWLLGWILSGAGVLLLR